jgi:hypothetical protein
MNILTEKFESEPIEHRGQCDHSVGVVLDDGENCTLCGYFVPRCHLCGEFHPMAITPFPEVGNICPYRVEVRK